MGPIPLAYTSVLEPLFGYLGREATLELGEITRARLRLRAPAALVPAATAGEIWESAARLSGQGDLGLRVGSASRPEDVGSLGAMVRRAPNVATALRWAVLHGSRFSTGERYWVTREGDEIVLHHHFSRALRDGRREASEFVLMLWIQLIRLAAGAGWRPSKIGLEQPRPDHAPSLEALALRGARFEQAHTTLHFPRTLLSKPLPPPPAAIGADEEAPAWPATDFAGSIRQSIEALLPLGAADVASLAFAAGTSVRSLQRRMAREGFHFSELLEACRLDAAQRLLSDPRNKVIEVADRLGYRDAANFTRAFRRWTGASPREFRRVAQGLASS
jgi:AraC-like DNA-binding protein